jgi:hypothetical protein
MVFKILTGIALAALILFQIVTIVTIGEQTTEIAFLEERLTIALDSKDKQGEDYAAAVRREKRLKEQVLHNTNDIHIVNKYQNMLHGLK